MKQISPFILSLAATCNAWSRPVLTYHSSIARSQKIKEEKALTTLMVSSAPVVPNADILPEPITIPITSPTTKAKDDAHHDYIIHKGRAVDMIKRCVAIEGLSLSHGWTPQATQAFNIAVEAVVRANPILTGKLVEVKKTPWPWSHRSELWIKPNAFPPESHSFVTLVDPPPEMLSPEDLMEDDFDGDVNANKLFHHVHSVVAPHILSKASFSANQIESGCPLFEAKLMDFGDGMAAYSIKMSHAIGDGTTFFQIVSQISAYMNGREPSPIDWDNPLKATHEIYPETFSERDYRRSYEGPFGWGILKNLRTLKKRKCKYLLLSKEKIAQKKKELQHSSSMDSKGFGVISANDIIMSALCEMCGSSDIFAFDRTARGVKEGVSKSSAGNFFWEIPFEREKGTNPFEIRRILSSDQGNYFGTDEVPLMPFLNGRVGRITSLASITQKTNFPGSKVICQFPSASFIQDLPIDVAVIFRFDNDHWGIMYNFRKVNPSPLLDEIVA